MKKINLLIIFAVSLITISIWAWFNRPLEEPLWPDRIIGFSFSPYRMEHDPVRGIHPTVEQIEEDLKLLSTKTHAVRTYTVQATLAEVPRLAQKYGINVAAGGWLDQRKDHNEKEITRLIETVNTHSRNIVRVIVGNETLLHGTVPYDELVGHIRKVKKSVKAPVSTAEPWHVWIKYPKLVEEVDFIAVHMLPYWEGIDANEAVEYIVARYNDLKQAYPDKRIVIGEVGWPSEGRQRKLAEATPATEAMFLRRFLERATQEKYVYYVMEAFDQPWKSATGERGVGAYWGVYDVERHPKFPFDAPIVNIPQWYVLAGASMLVGLIVVWLLLMDGRTLRLRARGFLAAIAYAASSLSVWVVYNYSQQYLTTVTLTVGIIMVMSMLGVIVVLFAEAHEWAEAVWVSGRRRAFVPVPVADEHLPMVSVHVPAYNEPPEMMIETLDALAHLDYPDFEVLVIDNNTKDPAVWQPVEAYCAELGPRFRFFHVDPLAGFKAGALNFALKQTDPRAEVIAVIDSDYLVDRHWLRDLVPQFQKPEIAIVQAPQDYRDDGESMFKSMCYTEYQGFFFIGMVTRNERNAIIQHGTMSLVRRKVLEEVGGWAEWCITEDAELGLRIFEHGSQAVYIPKSYGRGVMPDTFVDYKKQRFRWAYGSVQILRQHLDEMFGLADHSRLTWGQRYHFLAGWMPWFADGINLLFNVFALFWSVAMILFPIHVDPPAIVFCALPLSLFVFKLLKHFYLYRTNVRATFGRAFSAALAGLALSHTIALAMLTGVVTRDKPFFRTPKKVSGHQLWNALAAAREEILLATAFWTAAIGLLLRSNLDFFDMRVWIAVLMVQSLPYLVAGIVAVISSLPPYRHG
jgi:exo-beta-1,3-glucanase (GH17 family)/cellulose synthase/poly-beta-1,6-N-acetylglucosamine synthase-like glycosyltransferase